MSKSCKAKRQTWMLDKKSHASFGLTSNNVQLLDGFANGQKHAILFFLQSSFVKCNHRKFGSETFHCLFCCPLHCASLSLWECWREQDTSCVWPQKCEWHCHQFPHCECTVAFNHLQSCTQVTLSKHTLHRRVEAQSRNVTGTIGSTCVTNLKESWSNCFTKSVTENAISVLGKHRTWNIFCHKKLIDSNQQQCDFMDWVACLTNFVTMTTLFPWAILSTCAYNQHNNVISWIEWPV